MMSLYFRLDFRCLHFITDERNRRYTDEHRDASDQLESAESNTEP